MSEVALPPDLGQIKSGYDARLRRVLLVNRVAHMGGVERVILTLASGLERFGWSPILATPADGAFAQAAEAQGTRLAACEFDRMRITADPRILVRYPISWHRGAAAILRECRTNKIDLVHVHHPVTALYALRACKRLKIPLVLHVHETLPARPLYAQALRIAVRQASVILCVSEAALDLAIAMGADASRTMIVHNGVDEHFLSDAPTPPCPSMISDAGPGPHIGLFGALEPRKGQHLLLKAAVTIALQFPEVRFWLIGPAAFKDKQDYVAKLHRMAEEPALRGRVFFTGFQSDVSAWISAMDIVTQPSTALESFGMSVAEALTLGRPVVASRLGGLPEVVTDTSTGLLVTAGDAEALTTALCTLLKSPGQRLAMGRQGAIDARARFTPKIFQCNVAQAYEAAFDTRTIGSYDLQVREKLEATLAF